MDGTMANKKVHNFLDYSKKGEEIKLSKEHVDMVYQVSLACYNTFMRFMANVGFEKIESDMRDEYSKLSDDEKNVVLMGGMARQYAHVTTQCYLENGVITALNLVSYFDDFYTFCEQNIEAPFVSQHQFETLSLQGYLDDAVSTLNGSTLDPFFVEQHSDRLEFETTLDASILLSMDFAHILFDNICDRLNELVDSKIGDTLEYETDELYQLILDHLLESFSSILTDSSNQAINEFSNIIVDPASKTMMKLMRYVEEASFNYINDVHPDITELFVGKNTILNPYEEIVDDFIDWVGRNQDVDSFKREEIAMLNIGDLMREHEEEAYEIVSTHTSIQSGLKPESRVIEIHARYMTVYSIYRVFFKLVCDSVVKDLNEVIKQTGISLSEAQDDFKATFMNQSQDLLMTAVLNASNEVWDLYYPKDAFNISFDEDEDEE